MFKWLKAKDNQGGIQTTIPFNDLESQKAIKKIQALSGVTQADFKMLYVKTIENYIYYISTPNQPIDASLIVGTLKNVILALKKRQGYLLPLGSDSETSFRQREEWTFALFVAALCDSIEPVMRANVVKALIPVQAYAWLHRNSGLFSVWQRYLQGDLENNVFAELIEKKKEKYLSAELQKEKIKEPSKLTEAQVCKALTTTITNNKEITNTKYKVGNSQYENKVKTTETDVNTTHINSVENKTYEIKEINFTEESKPIHEKESDDQNVQEPNKLDQNNLSHFSDQDFWHWLKQSINKKTVSWNQGSSFIHGVELGVLIQIPQTIDAFLTSQAKKHNVEAEVLMQQQRAPLTKGIKKHDKLIKNTRGSRINVYCMGKWEDRKTLSGVVVEKDFLTNNIQTISINPQLTPDPLEAV